MVSLPMGVLTTRFTLSQRFLTQPKFENSGSDPPAKSQSGDKGCYLCTSKAYTLGRGNIKKRKGLLIHKYTIGS